MMGIFIIIGSVFILGVALFTVCKCIDAFSCTWAPDWLESLSIACMIFPLIAGLICTGPYVDQRVNKDLYYYNTVDERAALIQEIEYLESADLSVTASIDTYSRVAKFNSELRHTKKWRDNFFVGIFFNQRIAEEVNYIEIPGGTDIYE